MLSIQNLEDLVDEGSFRKDLFHRLNVVSIHLPKLAERLDDLDELIKYFIKLFSGEGVSQSLIHLLKPST